MFFFFGFSQENNKVKKKKEYSHTISKEKLEKIADPYFNNSNIYIFSSLHVSSKYCHLKLMLTENQHTAGLIYKDNISLLFEVKNLC